MVEHFAAAKWSRTSENGAPAAGDGDELSIGEVADVLELVGCSLVDESFERGVRFGKPESDVSYTKRRRGAALWLRAERIRDESNAAAPEYEAACAELATTLRNWTSDLPPVRLLHAAASAKPAESAGATRDNSETETDATFIGNYVHARNARVVIAHALLRRERLLGAAHYESMRFVTRLLAVTSQCSTTRLVAFIATKF